PAHFVDELEARSGLDREGIWRRGRQSAAFFSPQRRWQQDVLRGNPAKAVSVRSLDGPGAQRALGECARATRSSLTCQGRLRPLVRDARVRRGKAAQFF